MQNREIKIGERTCVAADEQTWIMWQIIQEVERIAESLPAERQPYFFKPITFDEKDRLRGLTVIFHAGTVVGTRQEGALSVPERTTKILDTMGIPYRIVPRQR